MSYTEDKDALGLTAKTTPIDTDVVVMGDAASPSDEPVKKITFANFRAWIEAFTSYFNVSSDDSDAITEGATNLFMTSAERTKVAYIAVTQAVDLDQMETDIAALANGMVYQGNWDASSGSFPGGGSAQIGAFYTVSVAGTVDSVEFAVGDRLIAIVDNASTTTYAANWTKLDATDAVTSVDSVTGNVDLGTILFAKTAKTTPVDADTLTITDSAASNVLKKLTWANLKATLKTYFDSLTTTFTNKRITPRVGTTASSSSLTIDSDSYDNYTVTALAVGMTINAPSGTPTDGQRLVIRILDNSTARALTWNAAFRAIGVTLPTTTVIDKTMYIGCMYNSADSKWDVIAVAEEA